MHLTPEQIDRQPFRMRKRGYDIMQVRNFLREIAQEQRARQRVREELAAEGDPEAVAAMRAADLIANAQREADEIVTDAGYRVDQVKTAEDRAAAIIRVAKEQAAERLDEAEVNARSRSEDVLAETQVRLDALLVQERNLHQRIADLADTADAELSLVGRTELVPAAPEPSSLVIEPDVADFAGSLQAAVRAEIGG